MNVNRSINKSKIMNDVNRNFNVKQNKPTLIVDKFFSLLVKSVVSTRPIPISTRLDAREIDDSIMQLILLVIYTIRVAKLCRASWSLEVKLGRTTLFNC